MSVADKTIFQCPVYTLYTQLDGAQRIVIQPSEDAMQDFGVPLSLLAQWILSTQQIGLFAGTANPDNALGKNGDLYLQNGTVVKQKIAAVWVVKWSIAGAGTPPDPTTITAGVTETPLTIAFEGNASTSYALKRVSDDPDVDDWFDWNTKVQYDGSNFVITGDESSDVPGTFADSFIFGIRP